MKKERIIECEGRFNETRTSLEEAVNLILEENNSKKIDHNILNKAYSLLFEEFVKLDALDPYFNSNCDILRTQTLKKDKKAYLDIIPLIANTYNIEDKLVEECAERLNVKDNKFEILSNWNQNLDLEDVFCIDLKNKYIGIKKEKVKDHKKSKKGQAQKITLSKDRINLSGYKIKTRFGIGPNKTDNRVVSDAPYGVELYDKDNNLCLFVSFWYKYDSVKCKDALILSQIQQPSGTNLPGKEEGAQLGIVGMEIAKLIALEMKFDIIETYSAEKHPMFMQYPKRKPQFKGEFRGYYDAAAKALGFKGSRSTYYRKDL